MKLWILPLGGKGLRVKKLGKCKPLIKIKNKFVIEWFLTSIKEHIGKNDKVLVIFLKSHEKKFSLSKKIYPVLKKFFKTKKIAFKILDHKETAGPAETIFLGVKSIFFNKTTIIANHDQFIKFLFPRRTFDVFLPVYFNDNESSSYVKIKKGKIMQITEKKKISNQASSGIYGFKDLNVLKLALKKSLKGKFHHNNEFYVGPSINTLAKRKKSILPTKTILKFDLGSLEGINYFKKLIKNF